LVDWRFPQRAEALGDFRNIEIFVENELNEALGQQILNIEKQAASSRLNFNYCVPRSTTFGALKPSGHLSKGYVLFGGGSKGGFGLGPGDGKVFNIAYTIIGINPSPEGAFLTLKGREFAEEITNKLINNFIEYQSPRTVYTRGFPPSVDPQRAGANSSK